MSNSEANLDFPFTDSAVITEEFFTSLDSDSGPTQEREPSQHLLPGPWQQSYPHPSYPLATQHQSNHYQLLQHQLQQLQVPLTGAHKENWCSACSNEGSHLSKEEAAQKMMPLGSSGQHNYKQELDKVLEAISANRVEFKICKCDPPRIAMNWQGSGRGSSLKWGRFECENRVRGNFKSNLKGKKKRAHLHVDETVPTTHNKRQQGQAGSVDRGAAIAAAAAAAKGATAATLVDDTTGPESFIHASGVPQPQERLPPPPPPPPTPPTPPSPAVDLEGQLRAILGQGYAAAAYVLYRFLQSQKDCVRDFTFLELYIEELAASASEVGDDAPVELWTTLQDQILPHTVDWQHIANGANVLDVLELITMQDVFNFSVEHILELELRDRQWWRKIFKINKDAQPEKFLEFVRKFFSRRADSITLHGYCPSSSFGVFLSMPCMLAAQALFAMKRNLAMQDRLIELGFRSFAHFDIVDDVPSGGFRREGPRDQIEDASEWRQQEAGGSTLSLICGYNVGECPGQVSSTSLHRISQRHRDFVAKLALEYHHRVSEAEDPADEPGVAEPEATSSVNATAEAAAVPSGEADGTGDEDAGNEEAVSSSAFTARPHSGGAGGFPAPTLIACNTASLGEAASVSPSPRDLGRERLDAASVRAAIAAASEAVVLREKLSRVVALCRLSDKRARELLDAETMQMIFSQGQVGGATRGDVVTRSARAPGAADEELHKIEHVLDDLHDFTGADGVHLSAWVMQVTVTQHDGKNDKTGVRIDKSRVQTAPDHRIYWVDAEQLIRVKLKNCARDNVIRFRLFYVNEKGEEEEEEEPIEILSGKSKSLDALTKSVGEEEDAWAIKDDAGNTVLKLRFVVVSSS